jgi:hypothetical protein
MYVKVLIWDAVYGDVIPIYRIIIPAWNTFLTLKMISLWAPRKQISLPAHHYFALGVLLLLCRSCEMSANKMQQHTVIALALLIFISSFRRVLNVVCNLLGCSPSYVPVYHTTNFYPHSFRIHSPMKIEQTQCSETSAIKHHTPENNPKGYT